MENYGGYFKALREAKGMTLREVERQTDVSNAYLSQLESGKIKQPSPLTLNKLSEIYGVGYDLLMEKVGYPVPGRMVEAEQEEKSTIAYKVGNITDDEEIELLNYLKFMRSRGK